MYPLIFVKIRQEGGTVGRISADSGADNIFYQSKALNVDIRLFLTFDRICMHMGFVAEAKRIEFYFFE